MSGHRDDPWLFRTYAGFASAEATNERFRRNLSKGQTGLSVAFDLPTQVGYDPDHELARGEVGRVGVPVAGLEDLRTVFRDLPLAEANTSMTINATAMWLLALFVTVADERGAPRGDLAGTTQNDILKEYLSRGTYAYPPGPSLRLTTDVIEWTHRNLPRWNPINVCSYHLQEAGADPVLEIAFTLANAVAVLDDVRSTGRIPADELPTVVGRISFFCNAGIRFVEETAKLRAFTRLWDRLARERYGVADPRLRRFRYGVQVNSLGLTARQPENNAYRILLEMLGATLSRDARARAVQLPAWNEALGLPLAWDQQWSLRAQQVLAYETDLLEHGDLFEGSKVVENLTARLEEEAWAELQAVLDRGGSVEALGAMKERLVERLAARLRAVEDGSRIVVGVNRFEEGEPSPLASAEAGPAVQRVDLGGEQARVEAVVRWRARRDASGVVAALDELRRAAEAGENLMEASLDAARAGVTTGEWAGALRNVFGSYRAPTGLSASVAPPDQAGLAEARRRVAAAARRLGVDRVRLLVAKPGLDGHSNAAEQVALRARDAGFEVVYQGIRLTPTEIARAAADEDVHAVGLSVLSGAHMVLVPDVLDRLREEGLDPGRVPVVVGGPIDRSDAAELCRRGVARVFTPFDGSLTTSVGEVADLVAKGPA